MEATYKHYMTAAAAYAATVSALYLLAFWGSFQINVLEYVGFSDLLKNAVYPLLFSVPVLLLGHLVSELWMSDGLRRLFPPGGGADTVVGRTGRKYWKLLLGLYIVAIFLGAFFGVSPQKWLGVAAMVALLAFPLSHIEAIKRFIPSDPVRSTVLLGGLFVAGYSYFDGAREAWRIKQGFAPLIVDAARSGLRLNVTTDMPVMYVGRLGDHVAVYELRTKSLVLLQSSKAEILFLVANPKRD